MVAFAKEQLYQDHQTRARQRVISSSVAKGQLFSIEAKVMCKHLHHVERFN